MNSQFYCYGISIKRSRDFLKQSFSICFLKTVSGKMFVLFLILVFIAFEFPFVSKGTLWLNLVMKGCKISLKGFGVCNFCK